MARIDDGDVLKRCKNMDHSNHDSSTCTSPLKKASVCFQFIYFYLDLCPSISRIQI